MDEILSSDEEDVIRDDYGHSSDFESEQNSSSSTNIRQSIGAAYARNISDIICASGSQTTTFGPSGT